MINGPALGHSLNAATRFTPRVLAAYRPMAVPCAISGAAILKYVLCPFGRSTPRSRVQYGTGTVKHTLVLDGLISARSPAPAAGISVKATLELNGPIMPSTVGSAIIALMFWTPIA